MNGSDVALIDMISHPHTKKQYLNETFRESWYTVWGKHGYQCVA